MDSRSAPRAAVDPAVRRARQVVGLYGDPDVTWSIVLLVRLADPLVEAAVGERLAAMTEAHPHLGPAPALLRYDAAEEGRVLDELANTAYGDHDPLVRAALSVDGRSLVVAAHHGAMDGLGLLGAASLLSGLDLGSNARGIDQDAEPTGFVRSSLRRLGEALLRPPVRFAADVPQARDRAAGDWLLSREVPGRRLSSAALVAASTRALRSWNAPHGVPVSRLVVAMGLSRRPGTPTPAPDRDTAYARLRGPDVTGVDAARDAIRDLLPEPAFPVSDGGGIAPRITRLLSGRLGATVLVSNLGLVERPGVEEIRFWPVPTGPAGVTVGLASTTRGGTVTVRVRRGWFTPTAAGRIADLVAEALADPR